MIHSLSLRLREAFAEWLLRDVRIRSAVFGENSVKINPSGATDMIRWSGTVSPGAAGDMGMDVTSGRSRLFVGGGAKSAAVTTDIAGTAQRIVASGSDSIAAATTDTLATVTRNAGEVLVPLGFIATNTAGILLGYQADAIGVSDTVQMYFSKTANANETSLLATNNNATTARTLDWLILGIVP